MLLNKNDQNKSIFLFFKISVYQRNIREFHFCRPQIFPGKLKDPEDTPRCSYFIPDIFVTFLLVRADPVNEWKSGRRGNLSVGPIDTMACSGGVCVGAHSVILGEMGPPFIHSKGKKMCNKRNIFFSSRKKMWKPQKNVNPFVSVSTRPMNERAQFRCN